MKTAVEFLRDRYYQMDGELSEEDFEQAQEMQESQIIDATLYGFRQDSDGDDWEGDKHNAEKYYNETFKQQEQ